MILVSVNTRPKPKCQTRGCKERAEFLFQSHEGKRYYCHDCMCDSKEYDEYLHISNLNQ